MNILMRAAISIVITSFIIILTLCLISYINNIVYSLNQIPKCIQSTYIAMVMNPYYYLKRRGWFMSYQYT